MKKMGLVAVLAMLAAACAPAQKNSVRDWNTMTSSSQVAKVSNIKSLISPGFY